MAIWDHLTCLLINLQAGQEATIRTIEQQTGSKLGKEYMQGCILSPCLLNLHTEYIMWNSKVDEAQAGIEIAREISINADRQMRPP